MKRPTNPRPASRRYEMVEEVLRQNILGGLIPRGLVLLEGPIASLMQTSRAPVQTALQRLEAQGMIRRFSGRGFLVARPGEVLEPIRLDLLKIGLRIPKAIDDALQSRASWERIYETVESDVAACLVFGRYRLIEAELAVHFRVSRTVVRDVLGRLEERGLVEKNQSSHWIAEPLTAQSIREHFALRRILEPQALISAAPLLDRTRLAAVFERFRQAEATFDDDSATDPLARDLEAFETLLIDTCVFATPNERLREQIRRNLLPVLAAERALRQLGLPSDRAAITEHRLIIELLLQDAVPAAAAMLDAHLAAAERRSIAQLKIVAVLSEPQSIARYLTRLD
ncbi:GntR family transcriptional regulator [Methylocapsa sp. S129]|uniref:GntR family transcriptional regulator n=1 Tax=Methylocapsa sp. S129 TaxID=1641869 RepID=UPI00131B00BB|nr:GntR family transcriptional regulator [Methylocapsa sp. S129]